MFGSTVYIVLCSARNRLRTRIRRLREPRYVVGVIAGACYLGFTLIIRARVYSGEGQGGGAGLDEAFVADAVAGGAVLLALSALACWVLPFSSRLLDFSSAETAFLFPAPVGRRDLVIYRLLRAQSSVLTGALIMALAYPVGSLSARLRGLCGVWLILMTANVFFTIVSLARQSARRRRVGPPFGWAALVLPAAAVLALLAPLARADAGMVWDVDTVIDRVLASAGSGTTRWLLWPFASLVHPLFAFTPGGFVVALAQGMAVYAVVAAWLVIADGASTDVADRRTERDPSRNRASGRAYVARPVSWGLPRSSRVEAIFVWKGALQTVRTVDRRVLVRLGIVVVWMLVVSLVAARARGVAMAVGVFSALGALFAVFMAPQIIRTDLRQDLAHLELLKTWPVRGAEVIRGEILWPAAVVTITAWAFGLLATVLSLLATSRVPTANRAAVWVAFLILTPAIVLAEYLMHNLIAVLFPGWVPLGATRARGVDAVGQRLVVLAANWMGLVLALLPGLMVTVLMAAFLRPRLGPWVTPLGALITLAIVVVEVVTVTEYLGRVYERLDVTSAERPD